MNVAELIRKKRNGGELTKNEMMYLVLGYTKNKIPDYQFSSFLMAVYFNGMSVEETAILTEVMLYSGKIVKLDSIFGSKIDKHSTGGVGDKTSLIIAPIVAAAGVVVPMISGRGLGHTGGTLDKLEAIPGFRTDLNLTEYKKVLKKCGAVLIGQTKDIAPADKRIYALRDVTSTVESIPLITASIMSKKLAEGIDGLILDVKTGSGAFMQKQKDAEALATSLINTAKAFNKKVMAFITDMNQPLGNYIGNWFEVLESIQVLQGKKVDDLCELSFNLAGAMIYLGGKASSINEGIKISKELVANGKAFEKFVQIVELQGGDIGVLLNPERYPKSKYVREVKATKSGYLNKIDTYQIGVAAIELGAGREKIDDAIDPKAGIIFHPKIGERISKGDIIAEVFTNQKAKVEDALARIQSSIMISNDAVKKERLIKKIIN